MKLSSDQPGEQKTATVGRRAVAIGVVVATEFVVVIGMVVAIEVVVAIVTGVMAAIVTGPIRSK